MCGRVAVTSLKGRIAELVAFLEVQQSFNVAPTGQLVTVQAGWEPRMRRWGLIPSWAKDSVIASKTFNARGETVAEKPAFRAAFRQRRCLIPVAGFYEWASTGKTKTPFYISNAFPDEMLVFAGLWERWKEVETCTIITTEANTWMKELHSRMPASRAEVRLPCPGHQLTAQHLLKRHEGLKRGGFVPGRSSRRKHSDRRHPHRHD